MSSSSAPGWSSIEDHEYAAAESMLQHSRSARSNSQALNGFAMPDVQSYSLETSQAQAQLSQMAAVPIQTFPHFRHSFRPASAQEQAQGFGATFDGSSTRDVLSHYDQQGRDSYPELSHGRNSNASGKDIRNNPSSAERNGHGHRNSGSIDGSEPTSPVSTRGFNRPQQGDAGSWTHRSSNDATAQQEIKDESDNKKPAWTELKTKAGKERKRLPLACIACRRKKIRCSGEKPSCKHCMRSRIPCVYKVTARKAAPRTDYMAMLDKRLKRMEERVIKIIPQEERPEPLAVPRAVIKPSAPSQSNSGKKRGADEAFGPQLEEWAESKVNSSPLKGRHTDESKVNTEGAEYLPSAEIQDHLSEVFFDNVYGQSYHLLHKPSYMRRLRAGTVPPVLILAVCAISARFSTHPQLNTEPAFLRGETWAKPARDIALRRYDEPTITILTVLLLLGLHEFGTCQGGRSWMFAGMATRMAYALQLHRELDHDPLGRKNDKKSELSFTDREIRRRTMWSCFLMDRFNSSGTERPMFADEETIKVQLPIKESNFQMEIPGPTESLDGRVPNPVSSDTGQLTDAKDNMGVAASMVRIVTLWGRVIKYLNMGGKERDPHPLWDPKSGFAELRKQANDFKASLPAGLENTRENLMNHAAEKLGNQFLFMHIASNQVVLFLHRFAIPTAPGARNPKEMPKSFVSEAGPAAIDAANQISTLLNEASEYHAVAPFLGYCAFLSSTVHVWGIFSKNQSLEASCKRHLASNVKYIGQMKKYWGMFHFMVENLKEIYRQHADASWKGSGESTAQGGTIFQYGDWFQKYPHGVSETDYQDPAVQIKKESDGDAALTHKSDLQSVEDFFHTQSPTSRTTKFNKSTKKNAKIASQPDERQHQIPQPGYPTDAAQQGMLPLPLPDTQSPLDPLAFSQHAPQLYPQPCNNSYPQSYDLLPLSTPANTALLPQLDRHLVYGAYAGNNPTGASSASALNAMTQSHHDPSSQGLSDMWGNPLDLSLQQQQQVLGSGGCMGDLQTSAWFMPFNLNPPEIGEGDELGEGMGGMGGFASSG
ncbi:hypothetical protein OEA41_001370 [Lepraria neglecta]|uniref:Zn(2)-C6 fungal-type domain-containing protein n=1 Tax=Lepraria neglecta TaxID=209136 RepID=A0AAD9Z9M8_9LECA|nr:hypothetical protein OEA41_001370 [Lepraria neglecta]